MKEEKKEKETIRIPMTLRGAKQFCAPSGNKYEPDKNGIFLINGLDYEDAIRAGFEE